MERAVNHWIRLPMECWTQHPWIYSKNMGMCHLRARFSADHRAGGIQVGLKDLQGLVQKFQFCDFTIL